MNDEEKIDLLRRANYMPIDKSSETIAVQHCCSIHYHRCLVLDGVRRAALRNIGSSDKTKSNSIAIAGLEVLLHPTQYPAQHMAGQMTTPHQGRVRTRLRHTTRCRWALRCSSLHPIHVSRARKCSAEAENPTAPSHPWADPTR